MAFEPVPVSLDQDGADEGSPIRGEWDRVVLDRSVNFGISRELLSNICASPGIAGGPDVTPWPSMLLGRSCPSRWRVPSS